MMAWSSGLRGWACGSSIVRASLGVAVQGVQPRVRPGGQRVLGNQAVDGGVHLGAAFAVHHGKQRVGPVRRPRRAKPRMLAVDVSRSLIQRSQPQQPGQT